MAPKNALGKVYEAGKSPSLPVREEIVHLYTHGLETVSVLRAVEKVLGHFRTYGLVLPFAMGGIQTRVDNGGPPQSSANLYFALDATDLIL